MMRCILVKVQSAGEVLVFAEGAVLELGVVGDADDDGIKRRVIGDFAVVGLGLKTLAADDGHRYDRAAVETLRHLLGDQVLDNRIARTAEVHGHDRAANQDGDGAQANDGCLQTSKTVHGAAP